MTKECLVKGLTYLGAALGREYTPNECEVYYDFLKGYNYQDFIAAIKAVVKERKPVPVITDLISHCENIKMSHSREVARLMYNSGVFKNKSEAEKAGWAISQGYIPSGYENDFNKAYTSMDNPAFDNIERLLIGGESNG